MAGSKGKVGGRSKTNHAPLVCEVCGNVADTNNTVTPTLVCSPTGKSKMVKKCKECSK